MLSPDQSQFMRYVQAIGRGQRSGRSLEQAEAQDAMRLLLESKVTPEQKGAFLMLLRVREETGAEVAGFTQACRQTLIDDVSKVQVDLDIGCYAGKRRQLPWFLLAVACLVENGTSVLMHGTQEPQSKRLYIDTALSQLFKQKANILKASSISDAATKLARQGFVYANLSILHPQLDELIQLRALFGLRSCANTLARMLNPFNANYSVQGVHHKHVDDKHMEVAKRLIEANVLCFRGEGGEPEIDPSKDTRLLFSRSGVNTEIVVSADQRWELKPKELEVEQLLALWQSALMHPYGEKTAISTLCALLILLNSEKSESSFKSTYKIAEEMWMQRNRSKFLGLELSS
ncbi:glycosyl transferase family protein [Glaciecola sp. MH2013]|uniref:glycosyl transferase family protein n=1 Tax=Glaciecola sp. MH2013 TaxID=2785524 RepID=UPI00189FEDF4|nr:glycosyl transferase family protein [Glaciecola sp. MH2013]MBF7073604.1 glycosyl transferase family protein [Glaciecola sp. MH2013]